MTIKSGQVAVLLEELRRHGVVSRAAKQAGVSVPTARKYAQASKVALRYPRRMDAFTADEHVIDAVLRQNPRLPVRALLEHLMALRPERYAKSQLATLHRRVREWRKANARSALPPRAAGRINAAIVLDIYEALRSGPKSGIQLARTVGVAPGDIPRLIRELERSGRVVNRERGSRVSGGRYRLVRIGTSKATRHAEENMLG